MVGELVLFGEVVLWIEGFGGFEAGEGFGRILIDSGAETGAAGGALGAVGVVKFDLAASYGGEGLAEEIAEEHVGVAGADGFDFDFHPAHDV